MKIYPSKPESLKGQFRWKLVPSMIWNMVQSIYTIVLLGVLVTAGCLFYLWQWMNYRQIAQRVDALERKNAEQAFQLELLEVEIDYLTRPERLERLASELMSMRQPLEKQRKMDLSLAEHD